MRWHDRPADSTSHVAIAPTPSAVWTRPLASLIPTDLSIQPGGTRLGELLVEAKLATAEQVVAALAAGQQGTGKRLGRLLVELGTLDEHDLARVLAKQHSLEVVDLRQVIPEPAATDLMSEATARSLTAIPIAIKSGSVVVAVADPVDSIVYRLRDLIGKPVTIEVATQADILRAIGNSYRALTAVGAQVRAFESYGPPDPSDDRIDVTVDGDDAPVVQVVQLMIVQGVRDRASDIHIEQREDHVRVRYRIDGALHDVLELPGSMGPALISRLKILADMNIVEHRRPQDGQIGMEVEGRAVDIRVASTPVLGGEKVVLRLLDKSRPLMRLEQLGMAADISTRYSALLRAPYGMLICAGPTGSGKTTTLFASLSEINNPERNIMTIEDPVEYVVPSINQIQIDERTGITFADGLKSILRQDPDVILVGEVRDVETARIAVQSALTGHLVLSSLHATDSVAALHRMLDMGIENFLVTSAITGVLAQRLVRKICGNCVTSYEPPPQELAFLQSIGGQPPDGGFVKGTGCNYCGHSGYLGRVGVYELTPVTESIRKLILARASHDEIRELARSEGMRTMQEEVSELVASGVTTVAEVLRSLYVTGS